MSKESSVRHDPRVAILLQDAVAKLAAAQSATLPNEPIPGYAPLDRGRLEIFASRLQKADREVLVFEADDVRNQITLPTLDDEQPNQEHLALYHRISELRRVLQELCEAGVEAKYRNSMKLEVPVAIVSAELQDLKAKLAELSSDLNEFREETRRPDVRGVSLNLGLLAFDMKSLLALRDALKSHVDNRGRDVDAGFVWATTQEIGRVGDALRATIVTMGRTTSSALGAVVDRLAGTAALVASAGEQLFRRALEFGANLPAARQRSPRRSGYDLAIDFGTANTRIYAKGRGLVLDEPTVVAYRNLPSGPRLHAAGADAYAMLGRAPGHIEVSRPVERGVISDLEAATELLRHFLAKAATQRRLFGGRTLVCVPFSYAAPHLRLLAESIQKAGGGKPRFVHSTLAAAIGGGVEMSPSNDVVVMSLGAGVTDLTYFSGRATVGGRALPDAGHRLDEALATALRTRFQLLVDTPSLDRAKKALSNHAMAAPATIVVGGKDVVTGLPRKAEVPREACVEAMAEVVRAIATGLDHFLETQVGSPETPLMLAGGGALMSPLTTVIRSSVGRAVAIADDPLLAPIRGCGALVEDDALSRLALSYVPD